MAALPSYFIRNRQIVFLNANAIAEQLVLQEHSSLRMGAAIMIHAGLRLHEALWLTKDSIAPDLSFLSVRNRTAKDQGRRQLPEDRRKDSYYTAATTPRT